MQNEEKLIEEWMLINQLKKQNDQLCEWFEKGLKQQEEIKHLKKELQEYKQKEDKLREYMKDYLKVEEDEYNYNVKCEFNELLQILNGSDGE